VVEGKSNIGGVLQQVWCKLEKSKIQQQYIYNGKKSDSFSGRIYLLLNKRMVVIYWIQMIENFN
jgi:hypothetical protein